MLDLDARDAARALETALTLGPGRRRGFPEEFPIDMHMAASAPVATYAGILSVDRLGFRLRHVHFAVDDQPVHRIAAQPAYCRPVAARLHRNDAGDGVPAAVCSKYSDRLAVRTQTCAFLVLGNLVPARLLDGESVHYHRQFPESHTPQASPTCTLDQP